MSFDPQKFQSIQVYLDIINVFLRDVPIDKTVQVPDPKPGETWEQFRLDALQAMDIARYILVGNRVPDPCPGKIIRRYVELNPIRKKEILK